MLSVPAVARSQFTAPGYSTIDFGPERDGLSTRTYTRTQCKFFLAAQGVTGTSSNL